MKLTPRYGEPCLLEVEPSLVPDPATPTVRQRARLQERLAHLDEDQWSAPTRCDGWSVQDVVSHLVSTNQFWAFSISQGLAGEPTRFLVDFDPVASPAELVQASRSQSAAETFEAFRASNDALAALLGSIDGAQWDRPGEAPPGHLALRLVALHALWDGWIHERDVLLPLGLPADEESDEVAATLTYAVALGPAFLASSGSTREGVLEVRADDPGTRLVLELGATVRVHDGASPAGTPCLRGDAVELIEGLSFRAPLTADLADGDRWLLGSLGEVFDVPS